MRGVRHEVMRPEPLRKHHLACGNCFFCIHLVEAGGPPRLLVAFDNEGRCVLIEPVAMRLKHAVLILDKEKCEGVEWQRGAEPCEARSAGVEVRLKMFGVFATDCAVHAVGGDNQIRIGNPERGELRIIVDISAEPEIDGELSATLLQYLKKFFSADAAESMSAGCDTMPVDEHVDIVPVREARSDGAKRGLVGRAEVFERLVGEDHPPSERVVGAIALEHDYLVRRRGLLEKQGRVETGWTTADDDDFQGGSPWSVEILYA